MVLLSLGGCGGGGVTVNETAAGSGAKIGQLVDSPVANIGYRTESRSGYTNANGEFEYEEGENVTFFMGDTVFPSSTTKPLVTPLDLAGSDNILDPTTINIIRLLQSLDDDGNADNGIIIPASAHAAANSPIIFTGSVAEFEAQPEVINLLAHSGSINTQLVHPDDAVSHCAQSLGIDFKVGPFTAVYYDNATFIATETVGRPSINYSWSDFHGIDSQNFHSTWTGNLEVFRVPKLIDINFEVSWSDVSLYIDGVAISSWSDSNRIIQHEFTPGIHEIVIEYNNNWHTTGFNVSFTTNTLYTKSQAVNLIAPRIDDTTQVIYVGAYESGDLYNDSTVTLESTASKVFLFLSSYDSVNWIINNPHDITIAGIAYGSYSTVSTTVTAGRSSPTFEIQGLAYGYSDFSAPIADIQYLIGRVPDYTTGTYALTQSTISVP
jgi:hypothetical protein